jgi:hypothetical protein
MCRVCLENGQSTAIRFGFCAQQYFACGLDDGWLERLDETSYGWIQNPFAAVPSANVTGMPENSVSRPLRDRFVVEKVGEEMSS